MELKAYQEKIIRQLIEQEKMLSELYAVFARQFPKNEKFFMYLSKEENRHAKLIEKLYEAAKDDKVIFDEGKMKTCTLDAFIKRLQVILTKAKNKEYDLAGALVCVADYETSLIEKNIFTHFESINEKVNSTLKRLHSETLNHVDRVLNALKKVRSI